MEDIEVQSTESVSPESSPSTPESAVDSTPQTSSEPAPFHEHPRFKELIDQRNQFAEQLKTLQNELQSLKAPKAPAEASPEEKMIAKMRGIDPEFAVYLENLAKKASKAESLEHTFEERQAQETRQQASSALESLHAQNKVPAALQSIYKSQIMAIAQSEGLTVSQLPEVYKRVHNDISKVLDSVKRDERAAYVGSKKADASIPSSQPRPTTTKAPVKGPEYSKNPDEARAQAVQRTLEQIRAAKAAAS